MIEVKGIPKANNVEQLAQGLQAIGLHETPEARLYVDLFAAALTALDHPPVEIPFRISREWILTDRQRFDLEARVQRAVEAYQAHILRKVMLPAIGSVLSRWAAWSLSQSARANEYDPSREPPGSHHDPDARAAGQELT